MPSNINASADTRGTSILEQCDELLESLHVSSNDRFEAASSPCSSGGSFGNEERNQTTTKRIGVSGNKPPQEDTHHLSSLHLHERRLGEEIPNKSGSATRLRDEQTPHSREVTSRGGPRRTGGASGERIRGVRRTKSMEGIKRVPISDVGTRDNHERERGVPRTRSLDRIKRDPRPVGPKSAIVSGSNHHVRAKGPRDEGLRGPRRRDSFGSSPGLEKRPNDEGESRLRSLRTEWGGDDQTTRGDDRTESERAQTERQDDEEQHSDYEEESKPRRSRRPKAGRLERRRRGRSSSVTRVSDGQRRASSKERPQEGHCRSRSSDKAKHQSRSSCQERPSLTRNDSFGSIGGRPRRRRSISADRARRQSSRSSQEPTTTSCCGTANPHSNGLETVSTRSLDNPVTPLLRAPSVTVPNTPELEDEASDDLDDSSSRAGRQGLYALPVGTTGPPAAETEKDESKQLSSSVHSLRGMFQRGLQKSGSMRSLFTGSTKGAHVYSIYDN